MRVVLTTDQSLYIYALQTLSRWSGSVMTTAGLSSVTRTKIFPSKVHVCAHRFNFFFCLAKKNRLERRRDSYQYETHYCQFHLKADVIILTL